jgi:glycosyltransferase involved in cell wall biosynthesis
VKFTVITPCLNAAARLSATLDSVRQQRAVLSGRAELQHIVIDGASTDATGEIVASSGGPLDVISEADQGMYDALAKGLRRATGDWITYLNAGDELDPTAFDSVLDVENARAMSWVTGRSVMRGDDGRLLRDKVPFRYRRSLIRAGQYCRRAPLFLPFLQQEGTFWRRVLHRNVDFDKLATFRLAGDYYLWSCFAAECEPVVVASRLGIFQRHHGQLSENRMEYLREVATIAEKLSSADTLIGAYDAILWYTPTRLKKILNTRQIMVLDRDTNTWF